MFGVCRGVAGLVRFGQGTDYRRAAIGPTRIGGDASRGILVMVVVVVLAVVVPGSNMEAWRSVE